MNERKKNLMMKRANDKTLGARRSSLQVNLSYVSNLSDSGNGSLKKSQLESNRATTPDGIDQNPINRIAKITENARSAMADGPVSIISSKEQALNQSCQLLKDAILHKTREIFDGQGELAVKTSNILKGGRQVLKDINDGSRSMNVPPRSSFVSKVNSIPIIPTANSTSANRIGKSGATSVSDSIARISRANESVIISGSSKVHRKSLPRVNKVLRVSLTRVVDPRLEFSVESSQSTQSSQSSIPEDIGAPMTCSSFISGHGNLDGRASQCSQSARPETIPDSDEEETASPKQTLTPMEITAVQAHVPLNPENCIKSPESSNKTRTRREISTKRSSLNEVPMELTSVQSHIPIRVSSSSAKTVATSLNVNTSINDFSNNSNVKISEEPSPAARANLSNRLSLHVNTSLGSQKRSSVPPTANGNSKKIVTSMTQSAAGISVKDSVANETDPMNNMTLIARLRNISENKVAENEERRTSNGTNRSFIGEGPSFVEGTPYPPSRSILWKTQLRLETLNAIRNKTARRGPATVEHGEKSSETSDSETGMSPDYSTRPKTTIELSDSPCRFMASSGDTQIIPDSSDENPEPMDVAPTTPRISEPSSTAPPYELPSHHSPTLRTDDPKSIPENLATEIATPISRKKKIVPVRRPGKKRLLPLGENLELASFSPLSPAVPSPKVPIVPKRKKNVYNKKKAVREIAAKRIESMCLDVDDDVELFGSSGIGRIRREKKNPTNKKKPRKIISKKIVVKKIVGMDVVSALENRAGVSRDGTDGDSFMGRNSLNDFASNKPVPLLGQNTRSRKLVIVATGFTKGDVDLVKKIVKELGGAEVSSTVSRLTTHVVSTGVRTINLLRGIIRGCWLVSLEWILKSLDKRKWLDAEQYEMVHFSKAVQENRRDRQLFGKAYVPELFATCGSIYIEHGTTPSSGVLKELVKTAGGRIAENVKNSKIIIGSEGLKEIWILDSITTGTLQPVEDYRRRCQTDDTINRTKRNCLRGTQASNFVHSVA